MPSLTRGLQGRKAAFLRRSFHFWQRLGVHVTPNHFYAPVPDTTTLSGSLWSPHEEVPGVDLNEAGQLRMLEIFQEFRDEYAGFPLDPAGESHEFYLNNKMFESVDAEALYCMIRHFKPRRIFEIGSGFSTYLSAQAIRRNQAEDASRTCRLVAIEPYPNETLQKGFDGLDSLLTLPVQQLPISTFDELSDGDILFIDSSHVLKIGSDVQYEILELVPRVPRGVLVHFHDIFLPNEYPRQWVEDDLRFFTEQYALQAFLAFNSSFEVLWGSAFMHARHPEKLAAAFPSFRPRRSPPGSFWIRRTA